MALSVSSGRRVSGGAPQWRLAFAIRDTSAASILLVPSPPPLHTHDDVSHLADSPLWELPSFPLTAFKRRSELRGKYDHIHLICAVEAAVRDAGLSGFDVLEPVNEVQALVAVPMVFISIDLLKEPDFGPKHAIHTVLVFLESPLVEDKPGNARWFNCTLALELLSVRPSADSERIGLLAATALGGCSLSPKLNVDYQEYPPGMLTVPMVSRTLRPFSKTNLVIWSPEEMGGFHMSSGADADSTVVAEALIVDPGCSAPIHKELAAIVSSLPRKLIVFLTHHHGDHTEGLPAVKEANPDAVVIAHERTFQRLSKGLFGLKHAAVDGGWKIFLRGRPFSVIASPGHTDGHLCLFDCASRTLVAGDHCVGEGSSIIDPNSGGRLHDYMSTSYRLLELGPHLAVPMHGRPNFWPRHLLKGYIKHRMTREAKILQAIEDGAVTAFEIVSVAYKQTHVSLWPAAVLNVRSHVDHLQVQGNLPKEFSLKKFESSLGKNFICRWCATVVMAYLRNPRLLSLFVIVFAVALYIYKQ